MQQCKFLSSKPTYEKSIQYMILTRVNFKPLTIISCCVYIFFSYYFCTLRNDLTVRFIDEKDKELGRDYFLAPSGQCTATGYGNIKTITPRGGNSVYMVATCDLCGGGSSSSSSSRAGGGSLTSASMPINGQVTDCF